MIQTENKDSQACVTCLNCYYRALQGPPFLFQKQAKISDSYSLQIYASYKYPRTEIDKLKPGAASSIARKFDRSMVVSAYDESTRRVGPFQMKPAVALR